MFTLTILIGIVLATVIFALLIMSGMTFVVGDVVLALLIITLPYKIYKKHISKKEEI